MAACPTCGATLPNSGLCKLTGDIVAYECDAHDHGVGVPHHMKQPKKCIAYWQGQRCTGNLVRVGRGSGGNHTAVAS